MKFFLKWIHHSVITQLSSLDVKPSTPCRQVELQRVINHHSKVFCDIPKFLSPTHCHEPVVYLQLEIFPLNIRPYRYTTA